MIPQLHAPKRRARLPRSARADQLCSVTCREAIGQVPVELWDVTDVETVNGDFMGLMEYNMEYNGI